MPNTVLTVKSMNQEFGWAMDLPVMRLKHYGTQEPVHSIKDLQKVLAQAVQVQVTAVAQAQVVQAVQVQV